MTQPCAHIGEDCAPISETIWPDATLTQGAWDANPHLDWDANDGNAAVAAAFSSDTCPTQTVGAEAIVSLDNPSGEPAASDCQQLRIRAEARIGGTDAATGCGTLVVKVYDGATLITTAPNLTLSSIYLQISHLLTDGEYDNITDHDNLRMRVEPRLGFFDEFSGDVQVDCDFVRLDYEAK